MSGFSTEWLSLREPIDAAARAPEVTSKARDWWAGRDHGRIVDLGAGTGANLRYLAPRLGGAQDWLLVDNDPVLLDTALSRCREWAAAAGYNCAIAGGEIEVHGDTFRCRAATRQFDLMAMTDLPELPVADLVTGSALLDLTSADWCDALVGCAPQAAYLFVLSYNGIMKWRPRHPSDHRITQLINRHQLTDKGFGPALGPRAADHIAEAFHNAGYDLTCAPSEWYLTGEHAAEQAALVEQWAEAARSLAGATAEWMDEWAADRRRAIAESVLTVGHTDTFACPAGGR